jgi:hypothetical protein
MITLYLEKHSPLSEEILDNVRRLVLAHQVVYREERGKAQPALPRGLRPPALIDDEDVFQGGEKIAAHLGELELFLEEWSRFQTDACYCGRNGQVE